MFRRIYGFCFRVKYVNAHDALAARRATRKCTSVLYIFIILINEKKMHTVLIFVFLLAFECAMHFTVLKPKKRQRKRETEDFSSFLVMFVVFAVAVVKSPNQMACR